MDNKQLYNVTFEYINRQASGSFFFNTMKEASDFYDHLYDDPAIQTRRLCLRRTRPYTVQEAIDEIGTYMIDRD